MKDTKGNTKEGTCSICGAAIHGYGHNAWPINDKRCCDTCNNNVVLPKRIAMIYKIINTKK